MFRFASVNLSSPRFRRLFVLLCLLAASSRLLPAQPAPPPVVFNGAASNLPLTAPGLIIGIAANPAGDVYVSVEGVGIVKIAAATGVQTTVPVLGSSSLYGIAGLALDAAGDLFYTDENANNVVELPAGGGTPIIMGAGLNSPGGVAVDAVGNVFIADTFNSRVVEIPAGGGKQVKLPATGLSTVEGVAVDSLRNLYILDNSNGRVVELPWTGSAWGAQFTVPITGLQNPTAATVDSAGNLFVGDYNTGLVLELFAAGGQALVGSGFVNPVGLAMDGAGNLYVEDQGTGLVTKMQLHSVNFGSQAVGSPSAASQFTFTIASGAKVGSIAILNQGAPNLDFADAGSSTCAAKTYSSTTTCTVNVAFKPTAPGPRNGALVLFSGANRTGSVLASVPIYGVGTGPAISYSPSSFAVPYSGYLDPGGIAIDGFGNLFVDDESSNIIYKIAPNGTQTNYSSGYAGVNDLAVDGAGNLYIADSGAFTVYKLTPSGVKTKVGKGFFQPQSVAIDGQGNVYVSQDFNSTPATGSVVKISPDGTETELSNSLKVPEAITLDGAGNLYVADGGLHAIAKIAPNGTQTIAAGGFSFPYGVAIDPAGDLYVLDADANSLTEVAPGGAQTVLTSDLNFPQFDVLDPLGNLYLTDSSNGRVIEFRNSTPPSLNFLTPTGVGSTDNTDGPQALQIANIGNQPLVFTGLTYPTDFPESEKLSAVAPDVDSGLCTSSANLGAAQYCFLNIEFAPLSAGKLSENVTLTDNALNLPGATQSISVQGTGINTTQTINFPVIPAQIVGASLNLSATATSGLTVSFTSLTTSVCTVSGVQASFIAIGACTIQAAQPGNSTYSAATPVNRTFSVHGESQTITFPPVASQIIGATVPLAATASSGLAVTYSSISPTVCSVSGVTASMLAGGTCRISASQPGSTLYASAAVVTQYWPVNLKTQSISFPLPPTQHLLTPYTLSATATSGLAVSFTSSTPAVCSVSGTTLTPVAAGICTVTASQPGNSTYSSASVLQSFHVAPATQTIKFQAPVNGPIGSKLYLSATASSGLAVTFTSLSPANCSVSGNSLSLSAAGNCVVQASQSGNATYAPASAVTQTIRVLNL